MRSHNATSAEEEGIITTTQTTGTLANNASGKENEQKSYIARTCWSAQYVVKVVVLIKRNGIINNFCARTTPRAQGERGIITTTQITCTLANNASGKMREN